MTNFSQYYKLRRGIGYNDLAHVVETIPGDKMSFKFLCTLKEVVEEEYGIGMSLNRIITSIAGAIGFHLQKDYDYYMKKAKQAFFEKYLSKVN